LSSVARSVNYELSTPTKLGIRFIAPWAQKANGIITAN
jgi:multiple sugar transport system substrate-binding protein